MARLLTPGHAFWCSHPARIWQDLPIVDGWPLEHNVEAGIWENCPYKAAGNMTDEQLVDRREAWLDTSVFDPDPLASPKRPL
jgi:hypothetical protein